MSKYDFIKNSNRGIGIGRHQKGIIHAETQHQDFKSWPNQFILCILFFCVCVCVSVNDGI